MPVQSVIFDKSLWSLEEAKKYIHERPELRVFKVDETGTSYRFRQLEPMFYHYYTKIVAPGVKYVIGF